MSSTLSFTYNDSSIKDIVQLNSYLTTEIGNSFKYVNYSPKQKKLVVTAVLSETYTDEETLHSAITAALNVYTDPIPTTVANSIQTSSTLRMDSFSSYTGNSVTAKSTMNMDNNRITNLAPPLAMTDGVNKAYVDSISPGVGLSKNITGPVFNVNLNSSLYVDGANQIGISSAALATGLAGGNGAAISVMANQPQITTVGSLSNLSVIGMLTAYSGLSVENKKIINVANPVDPLDVANKQYVDSTVHFAAGNALSSVGTLLSVNVDTFSIQINNNALRINPSFIGYGLTGGGTTQLSVLPNQPNIISLGTLVNLNVGGIAHFQDTTDAVSGQSGSIRTSGGIGVEKSAHIVGNVYIGNGLNVNNKVISNVANPVNALDASNRAYVDSIISTAGQGIVKTGTTLSVDVDNESLQISSQNKVRISSAALGTGLSGGSGSVISVVPNQSQITQVGTLLSLYVAGNTVLNSTSVTTGVNTGALQIAGGMYVAKASIFETNVTIRGMLSVNGTLGVSSDSVFSSTTESTGLNTGSVNILGGASVNKNLNVGGTMNMNNQKIINVSNPSANGDAANKGYVDSLIVTAGAGLNKSGTIFSVVVDNTSLEITDGVVRVASIFAGTGLTGGSGQPLSVNAVQPQITTVGMLSSLSVNGVITAYSGMNANNARISSLGTPLYATDASTKGYVDTTRPTPGSGLISGTSTLLDVNVDTSSIEVSPENKVRISSSALGTGLSGGSGTVISVISNQEQVTTIGTLTSLSVDGATTFNSTTDATSSISGAVNIVGGLATGKQAFFGGSVYALSDFSVTGNSTFLSPSVFSEIVTLLNTVDSTDDSTGSLLVLGGISSKKTIFSKNGYLLPNGYRLSSTAVGKLNINHSDPLNKNGILSLMNTSVEASPYSQSIRLYNYGSDEMVDTEYLEIIASGEYANIRTGETGTGSSKTLLLNNILSIDKVSGIINVSSTQNSTSPSTGAFVLSSEGGMGVGGNVHIGGMLVVENGIDAKMTKISNVGNPTNPYDAVNLMYVNSVAQGLSVKQSVNSASIASINLNDLMAGYIMDGITLVSGDRVLLKNQDDAKENGIYTIGETAPPNRSADFATGSSAMGAFVFVESGDVNKASGWVNSTPGTSDVVGTDSLIFSQFSGAGQITAGLGMSKNGNILDVNVDNTSIEINNDVLRLGSGAIGTGLSGGSGTPVSVNTNLSHVTGLGTVSTGTWQADTISVLHGGTGTNTFTNGAILMGNNTDPINTSNDLYYNSSRLFAPSIVLTATTESVSSGTGALVVKGGIATQGNLNVTGNTLFLGTVSLPDPVNVQDAATRGYVDSNLATPGTGLSKTGTIMSINADLNHVTNLGTLVRLTSSGDVYITDTSESTSLSTGSLVTLGGISVNKSVLVGNNLNVLGNSVFTGTVDVSNPSLNSHVANKGYVDSLISTAGTGLSKSGNVFSVNPTLEHVTSVGTLANLNVSGIVSITDTSNVSSATSGALRVAGGVGIVGGLFINGQVIAQTGAISYGNIQVTSTTQSTSYLNGSITTLGGMGVSGNINTAGIMRISNTSDSTSGTSGALIVDGGVGINKNLNVIGSVVIRDPVADNEATTKGYVDRNLSTAGIGLSKSGTVLSVVSQLDHVTRIGTQSLFTVSGISTFSNTTASTSNTTGAIVLHGGMGISGNIVSSGNIDLSPTSFLYVRNTGFDAVQISGGVRISESLLITRNITVGGTSTFQGVVTVPPPINASDAVTKAYTDNLTYLTAGTGLTKTTGTLSVNASQTQITTLGTLTGLTVSGTVSIVNTTPSTSTTSGSLIIAGGVGVQGSVFIGQQLNVVGRVTIPTLPLVGNDAVNKTYTDGLTYLTAGTGLTKTGDTLSINESQTQITTVGTLTSLTSNGVVTILNTTPSTSKTSGALVVNGGVGINGAVNLGSTVFVAGNATFAGSIDVPTPTINSNATSKEYVDALSYVTAGTGLSKTGSTLSINPNQNTIISLGTLTNLTSNGTIVIHSTAPSTSTTTGSLVTKGGIGSLGSLYLGQSATVVENITLGGYISFGNTWIASILEPSYTCFKVRNSDTTNVDMCMSLANDATTESYKSIIELNAFGIRKNINFELMRIESGDGGGKIFWNEGGTGVKRPLTIYNETIFNTNGTVSFVNTTDSTSVTTGAIRAAGGASFAKSVYIGGNMNIMGNTTLTGVVTVPTPISGTDATSKSYVDSLSYVTAGTGLTRTGSTLSVNAQQTQVTSVGILTGLVSSGVVTITDTTISSSISTGALHVEGGVSTKGSLYVGASLYITGASMLNGKVTVPTPVDGTDAVTKSYTDSAVYLTAGTGLSKTGATFSVNAVQSQITSVGTLTSLTTSGDVLINATTPSTSINTGALRVNGGFGCVASAYIGGNIQVNGSSVFTGDVTVPSVPLNASSAVSKSYTDSAAYLTAGTGLTKSGATFSVNATQPQVTLLGTLSSLHVNGNTVLNGSVIIPTPTDTNEAATKGYVDSAVQGLNIKESVIVGTTQSGNLETSFAAGSVIDGVTLAINDRILIKNQTNSVENGIYIVTSGTPNRSVDFATGTSAHGNFVFITAGNINVSSGWVVSNTTGNDTVGTHGLTFTQFSGAGQIIAGGGINKSGNTLSVSVDNSSLQIDANGAIRIASGAIGTGLSGGSGVPISINSIQPTITSLGTLSGLSVAGIATLSTLNIGTKITVPAPVNGTDAVTKEYTDTLSYLSAGTGLTKTGGTLSINANQSTITSVGILSGLTTNGILSVTNTMESTSSTTGSVVVSGGQGIGKNLYVGGNLNLSNYIYFPNSMFTFTSPGVTDGRPGVAYRIRLTDPLNTDVRFSLGNSVTTTNYSSRIGLFCLNTLETSANTERLEINSDINGGYIKWFQTGTGLMRPFIIYEGTKFNENGTVTIMNTTDSTSTTTGSLVLYGGMGVAGTLNSNIAKVANLTVSILNITSTTVSSSVSTGAIVINGGCGIAGSVNVGGNFNVTGSSIFTGSVTVPITPLNPGNVASKSYVDSSISTAGSGLTKTGTALSVNSAQPGITSLGTLTALNSSGSVLIMNTTESTSMGNGALVVSGGVSVTKNLHVNGATNLMGVINLANNMQVYTATEVLSGQSGTTYRIRLNDPANSNTRMSLGNIATSGNYESRMSYFCLNTIETSANTERFEVGANGNGGYMTWITTGTGVARNLTIYGNTIFNTDGTVAITNTTASTSNTTGAFRVSGGVGILGSVHIGENITVSGTSSFTGTVTVPVPTSGTHSANKTYVDGMSYFVAGTGLSKSGSTVSVNASQTQITSIGTLLGLTSSGQVTITNTTVSTSTSTGSLIINGGTGISGSVNIGGRLSVMGAVTVPVPIDGTDAVNKTYTDGLTYLSVSNGLTKTGNNVSINSSQPGITSVGTLTGLTSSGLVLINNTTASSSTTTGALTVGGGIGVGGALNVADAISVGTNVNYGSALTTFAKINTATATNIWKLRNVSTTNPITVLSVGNSLMTTNYTSRLTLFTLNATETSANTEQLTMSANATGANIDWGTAGTGVMRPLTVYGNTVFNTDGTVLQTSTVETVSSSTGSIRSAGGMSIAKSLYIGNLLYVSSPNSTIDSSILSGSRITRLRNTDSVNTETQIGIANTATTVGYTSRIRLYALGNSDSTNQEYLDISGTASGAVLNWSTTGSGIARSLSIYNGTLTISANRTTATIGSTTQFVINNTTDSTSNTTGSVIVAGGLGVAKNISAASASIGNISLLPFQTSAGWINMPTTGSSGIGTGGVGSNCWIGYAASAGIWFTNSLIGDICYRNTSGKLLFGNTTGAASIAIAGDNVGIGTVTPGVKLDVIGDVRNSGILTNTNTADSTTPTNGAVVVAGGVGVSKTITTGTSLRIMGSTSGNVSLNVPAAVTTYTLTLPASPPSTSGQYLISDATGKLSYSAASIAYDDTTVRTNMITYVVSTTSFNGTCTVYPTNNGTPTGTSLFPTTILSINSNAVSNTAIATNVCFTGVKSVSADRKTIVFNVIMGTTNKSFDSTQFAPNGTQVYITIVGY